MALKQPILYHVAQLLQGNLGVFPSVKQDVSQPDRRRIVGQIQGIKNIKLCMFFGSYALRRVAAAARRNRRCFRSASLLLLDVVRKLA